MSDKISYVLEVLDKYSTNTRKFKKEIKSLETSINSLNKKLSITSLNVGKLGSGLGLTQTIRQTDSLKRNIDGLNRSSQQSVNIAQQHARVLSANSRRAYAGAFTPIRFNPSEGKYQPIQQKMPYEQPQQPSRRGGFFAGGDGVSFGGVAKAVGYYSIIDKAVGLPREIIETRRQFDALGATLQTVLPSYNKTTSSSVLAAQEMEYLIGVVRTLGLDLNATKEEYVKFLAASAGKKSLPQVRKEFESFAKLSTVYGIDPYRFKLVMNAITQMTSKGIVNLEELQRQLGDSLPGAVKLFADSLGLSEPVFRKLVSDGRITAGVLANVSDYIDKNAQITSGLDIAMQKLGARLNRVSTSWTLLVESLSQGDAGVMINDWVTILDNGIQKLTKSLEIMGSVWNSSPIKGIRKMHDIAEVGSEIIGQASAALYFDLTRGGNEGRSQFKENLSQGNFESYRKNFANDNPFNNQFTPIPQSPMTPQEVLVKIVGENLPAGISIKQESYGMTPRPRTVIAGGL